MNSKVGRNQLESTDEPFRRRTGELPAQFWPTMIPIAMLSPFSLYIHIPYCVSKCPYCDFNSHVVAQIPEEHYTEALLRELSSFGESDEWRGRTVQSIFFGGGTPSTFKPAKHRQASRSVAATFPIQADCEITLEANPGTVDSEQIFWLSRRRRQPHQRRRAVVSAAAAQVSRPHSFRRRSEAERSVR